MLFVPALLRCLVLLISLGFASAPAGASPPDPSPGLLSGADWQSIRAQIDLERYAVRADAGSGLVADNRAQQMELDFDSRGVHARSKGSGSARALILRTVAVGRTGAIRAVVPATPIWSGQRVEYAHGQTTEWYVNTPAGLEHGYDFARALAGRGTVAIEIAIAGGYSAQETQDGLAFTQGAQRLSYGHLKVQDADGRELPAQMKTLSPALVQLAFDDTGARYPVTVDPLLVNEEAKLAAAHDNNFAVEFAGFSVAVSGDVAVVGAPLSDVGTASIRGGRRNAGTAYVFERSGDAWTQRQTLYANDNAQDDGFGHSVAILRHPAATEAYYILVGAPNKTVGSNPVQGAAYLFYRPDAQSAWTQQVKLVAGSNGLARDRFGESVSLSAFSRDRFGLTLPDIYAAIGAPESGNGSGQGGDGEGKAYIFSRPFADPPNWQQRAVLRAGLNAGERFGASVSFSGKSLLIGAPARGGATAVDFTGAAFVYTGSGSSWAREAVLTASDRAAGDAFGLAVSLSGSSALVGAPYDDIGSAKDRGSAYVFARSGSGWTEQSKLLGQAGASGDNFGFAAALRGNVALVGAPLDNGDGSGSVDLGSVSLFQRSGSNWSAQAKAFAADGAPSDVFGRAVAMDGDALLVGASRDDHGTNQTDVGSAYVLRIAADWGDAPSGFPTLRASGGALHLAGSSLKLGANRDTETDGKPDVAAAGDDANSPDDEDGVTFSTLNAGAAASLKATVSGSSGKLNAWIDFNRDGDWFDAGEQVAINRSVAVGSNTVNFSVPSGASPGPAYARVRLSKAGGAGVNGLADNGEVEDYRVRLTTP